MPANAELLARVRELLLKSLPENPDVEEKKMFNGVAFMLNGKMCICVSNDEIMCRVNPLLHNELVEQNGCRAMERNGKPFKGFVFVESNAIATTAGLYRWLQLCLEYIRWLRPRAKRKSDSNVLPLLLVYL